MRCLISTWFMAVNHGRSNHSVDDTHLSCEKHSNRPHVKFSKHAVLALTLTAHLVLDNEEHAWGQIFFIIGKRLRCCIHWLWIIDESHECIKSTEITNFDRRPMFLERSSRTGKAPSSDIDLRSWHRWACVWKANYGGSCGIARAFVFFTRYQRQRVATLCAWTFSVNNSKFSCKLWTFPPTRIASTMTQKGKYFCEFLCATSGAGAR